MEKKLSYLNLPAEHVLEIITFVLDQLDEKILIIDKEGDFRYYNQKYLDYYGELWQDSKDISADQIFDQNLFSLKTKDAEILAEFIKSHENIEKLFNAPDVKSEHDVFTDIVPIFLKDEFWGILIVEHDSKLITSLNNQLNYYKSLSMNLKQQLNSKNELPSSFHHVIGDSVQMLRVLNLCAHVAPTQSSVCLLGESGTGKEVLAEAIHLSSMNVDGPMIKVNCAAIPESLMESELFGYEKGAFTGASPQGRAGKFELASGGTLFLDEIGEMPLPMQAKLLRVIQEKEITRVGGSKTIKLNFRLITATNRDLENMVEEGTFREDLYYRICVIPIHIPPLRERKDDIPLLANQFLDSLCSNTNDMRCFSDEVLEQFMNYKWPGNIRELKNCVERMAILCPDTCIGEEYLPLQITKSGMPKKSDSEKNRYNLHVITEKMERETIKNVLEIVNGNKSKAIELLGISKRNFYMKLEKYGLK